MIGNILRLLLTEIGPAAAWAAAFVAGIIALFAGYLGVAMVATLRTTNQEYLKVRYRVFRDLLEIFHQRRK